MISIKIYLVLLSIFAISLEDVPEDALEYLSKFGYYEKSNKDVGSMSGKKEIQMSIENFQRFAGLPITGVLDKPTEKQMKRPRCGMKDIINNKAKRRRRFLLQGTKWRKNKLSWKLLNDNNDGLSRRDVETTLEKAFSKWEAVTNLTFRKLNLISVEPTDIEVKFVQSSHGDHIPFMPYERIMAHAFYPYDNTGLSGDIHFNDVYKFTINSPSGISLLWTAMHEIGHSLGMDHSSISTAIMTSFYPENDRSFQLHEDDILGVQSIYGTKKLLQVKAIIYEKLTGITYVFSKDIYYKLNKNLNKTEGPFKVSELFNNLFDFDAGFVNNENQLVFFHKTKYYIYESFTNKKLISSGSIFDMFKGIKSDTKKIDGAFVGRNETTFLFTGDNYYQYNANQKINSSSNAQKITEHWKGLPTNIDAVFVWSNGETYFFKGLDFYRVDRDNHVSKGYPRSIHEVWLKVPTNE